MPVEVSATPSAVADAVTFSVWTGVLAGIATSVLIGFSRQFWISVVRPWIEDMLYRDAKIEGRWKAQFSQSSVDPERVGQLLADARRSEQIKVLRAVKEVALKEKAEKIQEKVVNAADSAPEKQQAPAKPQPNEKKQKVDEKVWMHTFAVTLKRKGHIVSGTMLGTTGGNEGRNYELHGSFRNMIITGTYESTDRSEIERGCFSLMLKNNGACFHGYIVAYSDNDHELGAVRTTWTRHKGSS